MSDIATTEREVRGSLERRKEVPEKIVFATNHEVAFILIRNFWHASDDSDNWELHYPMPGYIPAEHIEDFFLWAERERSSARDAGHRIGGDAMRQAIRNLIGAAPFVDLEQGVKA